ncbi:ABC transporter permease [Candidatus Pelagibacter sp.]|jgi:peptide/nickel transport system permease protein|nr:ABC transporter permease [Candidatus Pelagibacter sp.]MDC3163704.1 ABC transporter permease [Candidatus Pelagibacter sp.]|tara:strand:+ start:98 stop:1054 length:957 start_codon:yes stop_codon:yes gene_type:complete
MLLLILKRIGLGLITLFIVSLITFVGVEVLPGDACTTYLEREAYGPALDACIKRLGLDIPSYQRYLDWAANVVRGDFGYSLSGEMPINEVLGPRVKNSLVLASVSILIGIPLAIVLGIITALWRDKLPDIIISTITIFSMTIPEFISATLLILIVAIWLGWLPGIVIIPSDATFYELLSNIILPVVAISMIMTAHMARMVRSSVIQVMASDYVQMAILKGVPYWKMVFRHVLPNALLPAINVVALTIAWLLGGVVVTEVVFNYPGLGRLVIESISNRDLPVVQALAIILASIYVGINLIADLMTLMLNPRLKSLQIKK